MKLFNRCCVFLQHAVLHWDKHFKARLFLRHKIPICPLSDETKQFPATRFLIFYYLLLSARSACIMRRTFGTQEMICCRHSGLLPPGKAVWWRGGGSIGRQREGKEGEPERSEKKGEAGQAVVIKKKREEETEWMKLDSKLYKAWRGTNEGRGRKMESRGDLREPD